MESRDHSEFRNILDRENMQMTPKDLVQKGYDSFAHKDMDAPPISIIKNAKYM